MRALRKVAPDLNAVLCAGAPDTPEIAAEMEQAVSALQRERSGVFWIREQVPAVVHATNAKVAEANQLMTELREEGLLTSEPFDEPIEFLHFDLWHYYGRTAKHGAFMGGADFVQWHGNYELLKVMQEMKTLAKELRQSKAESNE